MLRTHEIRILVTGGTFDKSYDSISGELTFRTSHVRDILDQVRCKQETTLETVMLKDSLNFAPGDRETIVERCGECPEKRVLITHGTDTMVETAALAGSREMNKTVVLTGAMIPVTVINSDAQFNLGFAFCAVQALPSGVYIAMNGKIFTWDNVRKNTELGEFQTLG
jgi:L-asparaginase